MLRHKQAPCPNEKKRRPRDEGRRKLWEVSRSHDHDQRNMAFCIIAPCFAVVRNIWASQ